MKEANCLHHLRMVCIPVEHGRLFSNLGCTVSERKKSSKYSLLFSLSDMHARALLVRNTSALGLATVYRHLIAFKQLWLCSITVLSQG